MEVTNLQYIFLCVIFLTTTGTGLIPIVLGKACSKIINISSSSKNRILSCASCIGAGVFLFVCFMGLLPAADSKFHKILEDLEMEDPSWHKFSEFPWGFFVVTCGFLVIFSIDKFVHAIEESKLEKLESQSGYKEVIEGKTRTISIQNFGDAEKPLNTSYCDDSCSSSDGHGVPSSVMFLVALGIHSIFEGIAIGLQTEKEKVLEFSVAVLVHEFVMAVTFGLEVNKSKVLSRIMKFIYVILFGLSIPLGIGIGMGLQNTPSDHRETISAICEAFATGIFLHVIFIEILAQEFPGHQHHHHNRRISGENSNVPKVPSEIKILFEKIFSIIIGLSIMIILNFFMHGHH